MRQNSLGIIITIVSLALTSLCCIGGFGIVGLSTYLRTTSAPEPIYPEPRYAPEPPPPPPRPIAGSTPSAAAATGTLAITADNAMRGPEAAPVTIHIASDFQCPFCARVEPTLAQLDAANPGQIRWVWHDYPLPFHQNAMPAAEAAREVRRQLGDTAFWSFHDMLFENSRSLDIATIERLAGTLPGMDVTVLHDALVTHRHEAAIRADMAAVDAATPSGSVGTPCFLINGTWLRGAQPLASFQTAVDQARGR